jgi:hypothetical protein
MSDTLTSMGVPAINIVKNMIDGDDNQSNFGISCPSGPSLFTQQNTLMSNISSILCLAFAIYFAIKCKRNGKIDPLQIVLAILCTPCYILYRVARPCD